MLWYSQQRFVKLTNNIANELETYSKELSSILILRHKLDENGLVWLTNTLLSLAKSNNVALSQWKKNKKYFFKYWKFQPIKAFLSDLFLKAKFANEVWTLKPIFWLCFI